MCEKASARPAVGEGRKTVVAQYSLTSLRELHQKRNVQQRDFVISLLRDLEVDEPALQCDRDRMRPVVRAELVQDSRLQKASLSNLPSNR